MKVLTMKRAALLTAGLGAVGLVGAFAFSGTSALYTSQAGTQTNTINSGTVQLAVDGSSSALNISNFVPGDSGTSHYNLNYTGSAEAFVGLDFTLTSKAVNPCTSTTIHAGATNLAPSALDCSGPGELPLVNGGSLDLTVQPQVNGLASQLITDGQIQSGLTCQTDSNNIVTCSYTATKVLIPHSYISVPPPIGQGIPWPGGSQATPTTGGIYVKVQLPLTAGNATQGSQTTISLTATATQWDNNYQIPVLPAHCTTAQMPNGFGSPPLPCPISWS